MATIKVDAETLHAKAKEISGLRDQHDSTIQQIGSLINGLSEVFAGQAGTAYVTRFESMKNTFTSFSEMLQEFSTDLDSVANAFTSIDESLAGSLGSR